MDTRAATSSSRSLWCEQREGGKMIYAPSYTPSKATPETRHGCIHETGLERLRYVPRMLLGADDLSVEQLYFRTKLQRHNRIVHGWGWLCGGEVWAAPIKDHP